MPIEVSWLVPNRVIMARGYGMVTPEENAESDRQVIELLNTGTAPIHVVMDVQAVEQFPLYQIDDEVKNVRRMTDHPALGWATICGTTNPMVRFMSSIVARLTGVRFRIFKTLDEGLDFLKEQDDTIDWVALKGE